MSIFKCKMCGGALEIEPGQTTCECEYCGSMQTLPKMDDDRKANMYDRANHFRRNNEFDKAAGVYEKLLAEDITDSEAYWSLVLCRYGIEYVEDPATRKRIPTVNRAQYTSIFDDDNYKQAIAHADIHQKIVYEEEAKTINEIQKGILAISQQEEPFDVFICYKETDSNGRRTQDSVLANDLYHQLTNEGFKVFFSRITLEDKLGVAYEPYIFAALNSAKVMVVLGTRPEYFNAVWVRNEWSRYLAIVKQSGGKKVLIPAYRDMDPYDLPEEFSHLQAQDMSKLGFMQDLIRGIKKILDAEKKAQAVSQTKETVIVRETAAAGSASYTALLKRGYMALEDKEWARADDFFEQVLNQDAECGEAYLGKLLARDKQSSWDFWQKQQERKYATADTQVLQACTEDTGAIARAVNTYTVAGFLTEQTIRGLYTYDRSYRSSLSKRREQKTRQLSELYSDRILTRAKQYASGDTKKQIDNGLAAITAVLDQRIASAQQSDNAATERIRTAYREKVAEADRQAQQLHKEALLQEEARRAEEARKAEEARRAEETRKAEARREEEARIQAEKAAAAKKRTIILVMVFLLIAAGAGYWVYQNVIVPNAVVAALASSNAGDIVTMGNYGGEAVEWLVLTAKGDTRTMIAVKGQDAVYFNKSTSDGNQWETSYIRTWLNETYYNEAFSAKEQAMITAGPTGDKVWLLSVDEANMYFAYDAARVCYSSAYAKKNGAITYSSGASWWWLRSPGSDSNYAASVRSDGSVFTDGSIVSSRSGMARPVVVVSVGLY